MPSRVWPILAKSAGGYRSSVGAMERSAARLMTEVAALARIKEIGGAMETHVSAPSTVWALGDYHRFAKEMVWGVGPELVAACRIGPGQRVLDVAAGTGNVAIRAAEAGASVVASDLTPESLVAGEQEARVRGVELECGRRRRAGAPLRGR